MFLLPFRPFLRSGTAAFCPGRAENDSFMFSGVPDDIFPEFNMKALCVINKKTEKMLCVTVAVMRSLNGEGRRHGPSGLFRLPAENGETAEKQVIEPSS